MHKGANLLTLDTLVPTIRTKINDYTLLSQIVIYKLEWQTSNGGSWTQITQSHDRNVFAALASSVEERANGKKKIYYEGEGGEKKV